MNVLIIHAHHEPQSFCSAMKDQAVELFQSQGHAVKVSDLHAMKWNPIADGSDFSERSNPDYLVYALEQRHNQERGTLAPDIQEEIAKVQWADLVILNFPLYWCSAPAILKGWIDRVLVSGIFYGGRRIYNRGGMVGKRALTTLTLGGRDHMFGPDGIHGELNTVLKPLLQGTLAYCGFSVLPPFAAYHVPYLPEPQRANILKAHRDHLTQLDSLAPLPMPNLDHYDKELKKI